MGCSTSSTASVDFASARHVANVRQASERRIEQVIPQRKLTRDDVIKRIGIAVRLGQWPSFEGMDLSGLDLSYIDFKFCILNRTNFQGSNLERAGFFRANLEGAKFRKSILKYTNFYSANIKNADFKESIMENADFYGTNIEHAIFSNNLIPKGAILSTGQLERLGSSKDERAKHDESYTNTTLGGHVDRLQQEQGRHAATQGHVDRFEKSMRENPHGASIMSV